MDPQRLPSVRSYFIASVEAGCGGFGASSLPIQWYLQHSGGKWPRGQGLWVWHQCLRFVKMWAQNEGGTFL